MGRRSRSSGSSSDSSKSKSSSPESKLGYLTLKGNKRRRPNIRKIDAGTKSQNGTRSTGREVGQETDLVPRASREKTSTKRSRLQSR